MENNNYLIIISINFGENFPINEFNTKFGQYSQTCVVIEARFNDSVLTSDQISIDSSDPELKTELCFQVDRKQLHSFKIERKAIKLQSFLVNSDSMDRHFIGYTVIDLRNAKEYSIQPKHEWKTLLNPKYKGISSRRPQMSIALMINKLDDNQSEDNMNADIDTQLVVDNQLHENGLSQKSCSSGFGHKSGLNFETSNQNESTEDSDIENDINIRFKSGFHHIWDTKKFSEFDCKLKYVFSVTVAFAENIRKLFISSDQIQSAKPFHFRYSFLGTTVKTKPFADIDSCDFQIERMAFNILTTDPNTLSVYFELHPTIEIQFCDNYDVLYGFVSISLLQFANKTLTVFKPIEGSFMLLADNETIDISDPFPIVGVSIELKTDDSIDLEKPVIETNSNLMTTSANRTKNRNDSKQKSIEKNVSNESNLNHFCFAIDLRTIRVIDSDTPQINSCFLQFLYAFFGFTDSIKTFPSMKLNDNEEVVIPHGFCAFNFATTQPKLEKTFREMPLIIEVIEETTINTLIGTANVDLSKVLTAKPNRADAKQVVNITVPVLNEQNESFAQIQIIMFLQNYGKTKIPLLPNSPEISVMKGVGTGSNAGVSVENIANLDDLIVETALEIELWKEKQLILFRERLKHNESEYMKQFEEKQIQREDQMKAKLTELSELETKLLTSLEELKVRENNIEFKETEIDLKQKEINSRYEKLNEEIAEVMTDLKDNYEQRMASERNRLKEVEFEKSKFQEKVYSLERKLKERENKIKELEEKVNENKAINGKLGPKEQKTTSVKTITRNTNTTPKAVVVTREPVVSSRPISVKTTKNAIFVRTSTPQQTPKVLINNTKNTSNKVIPNNTNAKNEESVQKSKLIDTIRRKRKELIAKGVSLTDPIIKEIDSKLKSI